MIKILTDFNAQIFGNSLAVAIHRFCVYYYSLENPNIGIEL